MSRDAPSSPWYVDFFDRRNLELGAADPERSAREVDGIVSLLSLAPGAAILDLGCGYGRHAIPLARRGYRVTGQDLSKVWLERAASDARARAVEARWIHSDMRSIPFEGEFDAVVSMFTSFGLLEDEADDRRVLAEVSKALKPGGQMLLDFVNREGVMRTYTSSSVSRLDNGLLVVEEREFDPLSSRNRGRVTLVHPGGDRREYVHSVRVYTLTELVELGRGAGLARAAHYGGLDGSPLTLDSHRLVLVLRKPLPNSSESTPC